MTASQLIIESLPPIKLNEKCSKAVSWMSEFKISHLPVVNDNTFEGIISEESLLDFNYKNETIAESNIQLMHVFTYEYQHIFEAMKQMSDNHLTILPILDRNDNYIGSTTLSHLMTLTTNTTSVKEPGGVIVLSVNSKDYSLAQIAQIVESNNARILSSFITSSPETTEMEVTIKINKKDLGAILQTFNRYDYTVIESYQKEQNHDEMKDRFDYLMKRLDL
ncbi:MAG: CBS domain-containing protein [Flavobacteriales bacterium]|jgi:signal-transduction protein with cAMP-binding, CBS, and nucleotidyltransferase domain|tara:strand:+ start:2433 stop:3095 length:663 start_codon:yes stop_codon:yes gene_type:complete